MRRSAGAALERITGRKHGVDEDAWRHWWRESGDDFLAAVGAESPQPEP